MHKTYTINGAAYTVTADGDAAYMVETADGDHVGDVDVTTNGGTRYTAAGVGTERTWLFDAVRDVVNMADVEPETEPETATTEPETPETDEAAAKAAARSEAARKAWRTRKANAAAAEAAEANPVGAAIGDAIAEHVNA
ncbi:MAG: hypothetical protein OXG44_15125 [Gammaproteobacteria bacterium]|nr:hypothetical protein [Gammaproteobacteria bacterium]